MNEEYDLRESVKALGKLSPVLKDAHGNVIDGLHRLELYPDWPCMTVDFIDTPQKLEAARLAVNTNRRIVSASETTMRVEFLLKSGLTVEQISGLTGLSERTIYKYKPQELKDPVKVAARTVSDEAVQQTVKTQDKPQLVECERCHVSTSEAVQWHTHFLCPKCRDRAELNPEAYDGFFRYLKQPPPRQVSEFKPKETWAQRKAVMSPQHSRMELKIVNGLRVKGYTVETDVPVVVKEIVTVPDFCLSLNSKVIRGYIDGVVHNGKRRDKDEELRLLLKQRFPSDMIVSVDVKGDSDKEAEEKIKEIEEAMK